MFEPPVRVSFHLSTIEADIEFRKPRISQKAKQPDNDPLDAIVKPIGPWL